MVDPLHLRDVFEHLVGLPAPARSAYLDQACRHDDHLRQAVEQLLAAHDEAGSVFDTQPSDDIPFRQAEAARALAEAAASSPLEGVRDLQSLWPDLGVRERRQLLGSALDRVVVAPAPGAGKGAAVDKRLHLVWR